MLTPTQCTRAVPVPVLGVRDHDRFKAESRQGPVTVESLGAIGPPRVSLDERVTLESRETRSGTPRPRPGTGMMMR